MNIFVTCAAVLPDLDVISVNKCTLPLEKVRMILSRKTVTLSRTRFRQTRFRERPMTSQSEQVTSTVALIVHRDGDINSG